MGWTVLYIAFGGVALWLLGEVLLQHKARLRWRVLAFLGFMGVVVGTLMSQMLVIAAGVVAFAVGQIFVTLSHRRGFSTGWALGGMPGSSRRRRSGPADADPSLQVSDLEAAEPEPYPAGAGSDSTFDAFAGGDPALQETAQASFSAFSAAPTSSAFPAFPASQTSWAQPAEHGEQPVHAYAYGDQQYDGLAAQAQVGHNEAYAYPGTQEYAGYNGYNGYEGYEGYPAYDTSYQNWPSNPPGYAGYAPYAPSSEYAGYPQPTGYGAGFDEGPNVFGGNGYPTEQPYPQAPAPADYSGYPGGGYGWDQGYAAPANGYQQPSDTPPGGVWVPQQRAAEVQSDPQQYQGWDPYGYGGDGQGMPYAQPGYDYGQAGYDPYAEYGQQPQQPQPQQQNGYYGDWRY